MIVDQVLEESRKMIEAEDNEIWQYQEVDEAQPYQSGIIGKLCTLPESFKACCARLERLVSTTPAMQSEY